MWMQVIFTIKCVGFLVLLVSLVEQILANNLASGKFRIPIFIHYIRKAGVNRSHNSSKAHSTHPPHRVILSCEVMAHCLAR
jgi:hypothetical protein